MIDKERIKAEAEQFFDWPGNDKTYVTTTSMLFFAEHIALLVSNENPRPLYSTRKDEK